jgi:PDZ domain-containing protein
VSRRVVAALLAGGLALVLTVCALVVKVPYVTFEPGPTINVLGPFDGQQIVHVTGHKVYPDTGSLRMLTIVPRGGPGDRRNLLDVLIGWADPDVAVLPYDAVYKKTQTSKQVQQESAAQMSSSQDAATAAALTALKIKFSTEVSVPVLAVDKGGASAGKLKPGDLLVAVGGKSASTTTGFVTLIRAVRPGTDLALTVLRKGVRTTVRVLTRPSPADATQSRIGITPSLNPVLKLRLPFKVDFRLSDNIGGPSAGMMFALSLYDLLTPGSLTGGKSIAGTGEISPNGVVGPIGGIGQKLVGAQNDGARLFLVARENCAEALRSHYDKDKLRLVEVHTLNDAIKALDTWRANPNAALPRCAK